MDAVEPPRIVFESAPECVNPVRAEEALRQVLASARARGWVVAIRISAATPPGLTAEAEINDDTGARVEHHVLSGDAADCAGLAQTMGAWTLGALESRRQSALADAEPTDHSVQALPAASPPPSPVALPSAPTGPVPISTARVQERMAAPSLELAPKREAPAPVELGVGTFLLVGGGAGGYVGVSPFLVDDVGHAVFLRPSAVLGVSIATNVASTLAAARLDTCLRLPGRYAVRGSIQLDVCGGADVGASYVSSGSVAGTPASGQTLPYVDLGPSLDLRAEVGRLAVTLRGVGGVNIAREGFDDVTSTRIDAPLWSWRMEMDFSCLIHEEPAEVTMTAQNAR